MADHPFETEPYDWNRCTLQVSLQFLPPGEDGTRQVVIGVRTHLDAPLVRVTPLAALALPPIVTDMLAELAQDMPARAQRHLLETSKKQAVAKPAQPRPARVPAAGHTLMPQATVEGEATGQDQNDGTATPASSAAGNTTHTRAASLPPAQMKLF